MGTGRIRDRLTFSNVVALLALFIALGGISYAAVKIPKNSVGTKQLKKNAVNSSKVKNRSLRAIDFGKGQLPAGAVGPQGSQGTEGPIGASGAPGIAGPAGDDGITGSTGPQGTPGQPGTNGSSAGALVSGRVSLPATGNRFFPIYGGATNTTETTVQTLSPAVAVKASNLSVDLSAAAAAGNFRTFTLRVDLSDTQLTCTIFGTSTSCTDSGPPVVIPANSKLSIFSTTTASNPATDMLFGFSVAD